MDSFREHLSMANLSGKRNETHREEGRFLHSWWHPFSSFVLLNSRFFHVYLFLLPALGGYLLG